MKSPDDIILEDFMRFKLEAVTQVPIIAVYNSPKDYPGKYVARLWDIHKKPTKFVVIKNTLNEIRRSLPTQMTRLPPDRRDDPVLVETWF